MNNAPNPTAATPPNPQPNGIAGTLTLATCNVLNLALPQRAFYANQEPYTQNQYERKIDWLGDKIAMLGADVLAFQEVWDADALKAALNKSGLRYPTLLAPQAANRDAQGQPLQDTNADGVPGGAQGTPAVAIATRLPVESWHSFDTIPPDLQAGIPDIGIHTHFERAPLLATVRTPHHQRVHVLTTHMKSKRPKFLQNAQGEYLEDRDDPRIKARAALRSLIIRGIESTALRAIVLDALKGRDAALVLMGDFNDGPHSVTTQIIAANTDIAYDRATSDVALFNAYDIQGHAALRRDVAYSHVFQGYPEVLDQILVSEEFLRSSKYSIGDVLRVDYFNDHLHEGRHRHTSDHGFVRAVLRLRGQ